MKRILMILTAVICLAVTASAQTVYVSQGDGAVAYHKSKSCSYLANSKSVKSVTTAEAKKMGRHECQRCYGAATVKKATTTAKKEVKKAEKKTTTTAKKEVKKAEKKTTTAAKKTTTAARDEKGRFVKKADATKTATKKEVKKAEKKATTVARDEKGRFIKKAE